MAGGSDGFGAADVFTFGYESDKALRAMSNSLWTTLVSKALTVSADCKSKNSA